MFQDSYGYVKEEAWYDTMQVCLNGHQISSTVKSSPEDAQKFCEKCGAQTISKCPKCSKDVPGYHHIPGLVSLCEVSVPNRCRDCGTAYPWASPVEYTQFSGLVQKCGDFIRKNCPFSVWSLSTKLCKEISLNQLSSPDEKASVLSDFYWGFRVLYDNATDINVNGFNKYVDTFNSILRSLESCLKNLLDMLSYENTHKNKVNEYNDLLPRFNQFVDQYEQFLAQTGRAKLTFMRLQPLSDVPRRTLTPEGERIFAPGESYDIYKHVRMLISAARNEVLIIEPYANEELFELYLDKVSPGIKTRILTQKISGSFISVAQKFRVNQVLI